MFQKSIVLLSLLIPLSAVAQSVSFEKFPNFVFGLATAPAHSEDRLNDSWLSFARSGGVAAWQNAANPEERLRFWSEPEVELGWTASTGVQSIRIGLDWGRLAPQQPGSMNCGPAAPCAAGVQNLEALNQYKNILTQVRSYGLEPTVTLFHHSLPQWALDMGGWSNRLVSEYFLHFVNDVVAECGGLVDEWITFNEPTVYSLLSDIARIWPPGGKQQLGGLIAVPLLKRGAYWLALENMAEVHNKAYDLIHEIDVEIASQQNLYSHGQPARVGLAHNVSYNNGARWFDWASARYFDAISKYTFTDRVVGHLDFFGINYYGQEVVKGLGSVFIDWAEYSESGRAVYPAGLALLLVDYHQRYNVKKINRRKQTNELKFVITENGVSDATDTIRGAYLVEHLAAVHFAMEQGVPVDGYFFWTLSDNWEWADGYCPKFGLLEVDRARADLNRTPRPSYFLFRDIVAKKGFSAEIRQAQWQIYIGGTGLPRPQCRAHNGRDALDSPRYDMLFRGIDFRFKSNSVP